MMPPDEELPAVTPPWMVTYGDMMSLLLTFFVMLVSLSEVKEETKFRAIADSLGQRFGYSASQAKLPPGGVRPRNAVLAKLVQTGRAERLNWIRRGAEVHLPPGEPASRQMIPPEIQTRAGTVVYFPEDSAVLTERAQAALQQEIPMLKGKPQIVEVRGHLSRWPVSSEANRRGSWDLAYERCLAAIQYLVESGSIDSRRMRLSVVGPSEPVRAGFGAEPARPESCVEVYLVNEIADASEPTAEVQPTPGFDSDRLPPTMFGSSRMSHQTR